MSPKPDKAKAGQKKVPVGTWNRLCDMLGRYEQREALGGGGGPLQLPREQNTIRVKNESGQDLDKWSVVRIEEYLLDDLNRTRLFFKGTKVSRGNQLVAVLQWTADEDEIVEAQIAGLGIALVDVQEIWHRRARPVKDSTVLISDIFGPVEILGELTETGDERLAASLDREQSCVCRFGHADNRSIMARVDGSGITAASWYAAGVWQLGTGTVQIWEPNATLGRYEAGTYTDDYGAVDKEATVYNMAAGAVDADAMVLLSPNDEWLPLVTLEPCEMPTEPGY